MSFYEDQILPRCIDVGMNNKMFRRERTKALEGVKGSVLEVGFGSGLNLPHYPAQGVEKVVALDPAAVGKKLARKRIEKAPFPVEHLALKGEDIPAPDASFDSVVTTFTLCTIPDVERALGHMRRVLKPDGRMFFVEHGLSPDPKVRAWQTRMNGIQGALFGGCHLDRKMDDLIKGAGFRLDQLETYYGGSPKFVFFLYRGIATRG